MHQGHAWQAGTRQPNVKHVLNPDQALLQTGEVSYKQVKNFQHTSRSTNPAQTRATMPARDRQHS
jgi:hypothetical protein